MARPPDMDLSDDPKPLPNRRSESAQTAVPGRPGGRGPSPAADRAKNLAKTLGWLAPLTVLIWVYAERDQVLETKAAGVPVSVQTAVPNRYVEFAGPNAQPTLTLTLNGPHDAVDRVRNQLYAAHGLAVDIGPRIPVGPGQTVPVIYAIQNQPLFKNAGVTVTDAQPADLSVDVDTVVTREATVMGDTRVTNLAGAATFDPPSVVVQGPATEVDHLDQYERPGDGKLRVYADLSGFHEDLSRPGTVKLDAVPVALPAAALPVGGGRVRVLPQQVRATLQVRAADVPLVIASVPIEVQASPRVWHQFDVHVGDNDDLTLSNLHVTGPADQIEAISAKREPVSAVVKVGPDDGGGPEQARPLTFDLPKGVNVSADDAGRTVRVTLVDRKNGNGG